MWFWWFIFVCDLLIPVTMIIAGNMMWKHTPEKINGIIGYRTTRSMKNIDTWRFAQDYCGRLWWKIGWIMLLPSVVAHLPFYHGTEDTIGTVAAILCTIQCLILVSAIFPTERALKRTFTEEGIRK
ncbi:MAG: SdpI family protein [Bacillus sp. (in: Bacteria)]|nr:SdpI family protein [Butyrivibrio sp.]MCM1388480.1 SdpI family protein [Bacillus sp. (in: firmicutes)]